MTAEGTARCGGSEALKAELAAAKRVVSTAAPEERDGVDGPFVMVNGDSDGLSDRGSDMGMGPEADSPSDEEDLPRSNASRDEVHRTAGGDFGALDAAVVVSSSNGHGRPAVETSVESEDVVAEGKGEENDDIQAELGEQGTAGEELGCPDTLTKLGVDHVDGVTDSAAPAVDSEVNGKGSGRGKSSADVTELHEVASEEQQDGVTAADPTELDDASTNTEASSAVLEPVVCGEESKGDQIAAETMEMSTDGPGDLVVNGNHDAGMSLYSCVTVTEPASHSNEDKLQQTYSNVTEFVEKDAMCGGQDGTDTLKGNEHDHVDMSAESCTPSEFEAHADESKGQQLEAPTEAAVLNGTLDASSTDCNACTCKEPTEVEVVANGHCYTEYNTNVSGQLEPGLDEREGEATCVVIELEDIIGNNCEGSLHDGHAAVVSSGEEAKLPMEEGIDEVVPTIAGTCVISGNSSEQILQDDELVKDVVCAGKLESSFVESSSDQKVQAEFVAGDEKATVSDVKVHKLLERDTSDSIQTQDLMSTVEDKRIPLHVNSSDEVKEEEVNKQASAPSNSLNELRSIALVDNSSPEHSIPATELESYDHVEAEDCKSQEISRTTVDQVIAGLSVEHGTAVTDAGLRYETGETSHGKSSENAVGQGEPVAWSEDKAVVADDVKPSSAAGDESSVLGETGDISQKDAAAGLGYEKGETFHEKSSETAVDQGEPVALSEDKAVVADDVKLCSAAGDESSVLGEAGDISQKDAAAGLRYETGETSHEKSSETAVDQGEPVALSEDKAVLVDDDKPSSVAGDESAVLGEAGNISQKDGSSDSCTYYQLNNDQSEIIRDEISSTAGDKCSSPINDFVSPVDEPWSDVTLEPGLTAPFTDKATCKDISSENINACNRSSLGTEIKCSEVLQPSSIDTVVVEGGKDDVELAHIDEAKIEESIESHGDLHLSSQEDIHVIRPQRIYIIKVPRLAGEDVWARLQDAQVHLDRLTQERDALNLRKKKQKAVFDDHRMKFEAACQEESEARAAHVEKKNDLDTVRSMIGKLNKANSIEEIDEMIMRKEKIMEHETISLKEEKLFIKEINELKAQRKQLYSNIGSKAEIREAFHQKDHIHEQHKILKDSDILFKNMKSLVENTRKIKKSLDDERVILRKINDELQTANEVRQKAYHDWVELRGEPARKNKYFFMYKRDRATAYKFLQMGEMDGLQSYCNNQVGRILEMWNKDDDFRKLYVEANMVSTLRRLGTHDGRRLGPEEDPPVIPSYNINRIRSNPSPLTVSSPNVLLVSSEAGPEKPVPVAVHAQEDSFPVLPSPQIAKQAKSKSSGNSYQTEITTTPASERGDAKDIGSEKAHLMEELELKRKAEELACREEKLRQERAAAEKERLRLEQKAKAKEAEERKKKKTEKAQERAEFKARKEAEMKEKKKARKDKKTIPAELTYGSSDGNLTAIATTDTDSNTSENARDAEFSQQAAPRRISRSAATMKQLNRLQPMPLPLRNRGRRRMRQYILIGVAIALSLVALLLGVKYIQLPSLRSTRF